MVKLPPHASSSVSRQPLICYYKFNSHYYLEILSCFVSIINSFYCWAVFHCMDITQFVIMLSCWWMDIKQILTFDLQQKVKTVLWILLLFQSGCLLVLSFFFFLPYCTGMDVWFLKCFFFFFFACLCWCNHEVVILNFVIWWIDQYSNIEARLHSWDKCLLVISYLFDGFSLLKC